MPGPADFQEQLADARLPPAAGVVDDAAACDAAVDGLDAHATAGEAPIRRLLHARQAPPPRLPRRHHEVDPLERLGQAAESLEQAAACRHGVWGDIGTPLLVGAAGLGLTQAEDRQCRMDQQDVFDRVARFRAARTARRLNWILGARAAPRGPVVPTRAKVGAEAGAAAGGPDGRDGSFSGTTSARASAAGTPRRFASSVQARVGAAPSARSGARRTTQST